LLKSRSTSANGVAYYYSDDQNDSLAHVFQHCGTSLIIIPSAVKFLNDLRERQKPLEAIFNRLKKIQKN
jgi:hypothetical protein